MNERIKQLLAQAHTDSNDIKDTNWIANRFAELIVEECHEIIVIGGVDDLDVVKKHFGVKE